MPERRLRKEAYVAADGLPRPLRGHEPRDNGMRRQQRRRWALGRMAIDVDRFPVGMRRRLLEHLGPLTAVERERLCSALLTRGVDAGRIGLVFNLLGDAPIGDQRVADLVERIRVEHERAARPSANFTLLGARRRMFPLEHHIEIRMRPDDGGRDIDIKLPLKSLASMVYFRQACLFFAHFAPTFRDGQFQRFVETVLEMARGGEDA